MKSIVFNELILDKDTIPSEYVDSRHGLYPAPLGRNAKASTMTKVRQKMKFLGKFMGKALMDSRMVTSLLLILLHSLLSFHRSICHLVQYSTNGF